MSEQVGSRIKRSPMFWVAVIALSLGAALRLAYQLGADAPVWPFLVALVAVLVVVVAVYAGVDAGARALLRRVVAQRPTATVVLTVPALSMVETAARIGADQAGIRADASKYTAVAILPDRVELWAGSTQEPRWWVPRTRDGVALVHTQIGRVSMDALRLAANDGDEQEIVVRPVPVPVWLDLRRKHRQVAMEQFIRDLGHDPARILDAAS